MKTTHTFCASNAAITTMDSNIHHQPFSSSVTATSFDGGRAIDRHNPIIQDQTRLTKTLLKPPHPQKYNDNNDDNNNNVKNNNTMLKNSKTNIEQKRETIVSSNEQLVMNMKNNNNNVVRRQGGVLGWGCTRPGDFISPASSSRFLLTDKLLSDQFDPGLKQSEDGKSCKKKNDDGLSSSPDKKPPGSSSSLSSRSSDHQVVVLRVSLHCRGCEKKMRKHLSKMEGVTSFTIDFTAKKVTVVGSVTPLGVLMNVSKVKNAQLLTPTVSSPLEPQMDSRFSKINKQLGLVA
ncbi:putative heavy metal-associated domain, HMA, heavy metal-associated domain superfamily [Helianthus annuus]|nr:putative heavy metal-associated domain, HMA, heavy metal-associated domain superfamily [Helianthus annuus]